TARRDPRRFFLVAGRLLAGTAATGIDSRPNPMRKPLLLVVLVSALAGFFFASFSTYDFVQHLDRQVHGLHCSFVPGLTGTDVSAASGCHAALMIPYSS